MLTAEDWRIWREVRLRALETDPTAFGSTLAGATGENDHEARWRQRFTVPYNIVSVRNGAFVGQVGATAIEQGTTELISLWVAPEVRGRGVGDELIEAVVAWARSQGAARVELDVRRANLTAIAVYRRNGFVNCEGALDPSEQRMQLSV